MQTVRIRFFKHDRAKYISHLDLMRCMTRVMRRTKIPVWYTEGFHPHLYLTFAQPLSLGFESECEFMEFQLVQPMEYEEIKRRLNAILPPEMQVVKVYEPQRKMDAIGFSEFDIRLYPEKGTDAIERAFQELMKKETWQVEKKTKRGVSVIDIRPYVQIVDTGYTSSEWYIRVKLPGGQNFSLNPNLLISLLLQDTQEPDCLSRVKRVAVYDENGVLFE